MASAWFQATDYFYNKLNQMRETDADYSADALFRAFNANGYTIANVNDLNAAADQLERHFVDYGNAENVSPNNYFDVATYRANKLIQLGTTTQQPPDGFATWTEEALDVAMEEAGLSYWDHYNKYGTVEGINPSKQFDTDAYLQAKADQLNDLPEGEQQPLPDGSLGQWTPDLVAQVMASDDMSALEHYYMYGRGEGVEYTPGDEPGPVLPEVQLTPGADAVDDGGLAVNFVGVRSDNARLDTFNRDDQITGTNDDDQLSVTLQTQFQGFSPNGFVKGVPTINVTTKMEAVDFRTTGIEGATAYNLDGNINLTAVNESVKTVNWSNVDAPARSIDFASGVVNGKADELTIGLDNVGTLGEPDSHDGYQEPGSVRLEVSGIENLTLNSTGDTQNRVEIADQNLQALVVSGEADVKISTSTATTKLTTIDASDATGNVTINAGANRLNDVQLGSGNDTIQGSGLAKSAVVDGGEGADIIVLTGNAQGSYALNTQSVETLRFAGTSNAVTINGANMEGLQGIELKGQDKGIVLANVGDELALKAIKSNSADIQAAQITSLEVTVGDGNETGSVLPFPYNPLDSYTGSIVANKLTSLYVDASEEDSSFALTGGQLNKLGQVTLVGAGDVDLSGVANLGTNAQSVNVQAGQLSGNFSAAFTGNSSVKGQTLYVTGSEGINNVALNGNFDFVELSTSGTANTIDARNYNGAVDSDHVALNLIDDTVILAKDDRAKAAWAGLLDGQNVAIMTDSDLSTNGSVLGSGYSVVLKQATEADASGTEGNFSGVTSSHSAPLTITNVQDGQLIQLGDTAPVQDTSKMPNGAVVPNGRTVPQTSTNIDATGVDNVVLDFASDGANNSYGLTTYVNVSGGLPSIASDELVTLTLTNTAGTDASLGAAYSNTEGVGTGSQARPINYGLANVGTINLDTGSNADATVNLFGYANYSSGGYSVNGSQLINVENITITGSGAAVLKSQLGSSSKENITIDASGMNVSAGSDGAYISAVYTKSLEYTGSAGDDYLQMQAIGKDNTINLGAGDDMLAININNANRAGGVGDGSTTKGYASLDVTLGDGEDTILLGGTGNAGAGGVLLTVTDFAMGDQITGFKAVTTTDGSTAYTGATAATVLNSFGFSAASSTNVTVSSSGVMSYNDNSYIITSQNGGGYADASSTMKGIVCIELAGVDASTVAVAADGTITLTA